MSRANQTADGMAAVQAAQRADTEWFRANPERRFHVRAMIEGEFFDLKAPSGSRLLTVCEVVTPLQRIRHPVCISVLSRWPENSDGSAERLLGVDPFMDEVRHMLRDVG